MRDSAEAVASAWIALKGGGWETGMRGMPSCSSKA